MTWLSEKNAQGKLGREVLKEDFLRAGRALGTPRGLFLFSRIVIDGILLGCAVAFAWNFMVPNAGVSFPEHTKQPLAKTYDVTNFRKAAAIGAGGTTGLFLALTPFFVLGESRKKWKEGEASPPADGPASPAP